MPTRYYGIQNEVKAYCNRLQNETSIVVTPSVLKTLNDRVESLKRSGVWSQFGLGFNDNDGDAYLSRASVSDVIGRAEVLWFTRGMKSLGLWSNMVSWPLRSYQNANLTLSAHSLGGFGNYLATLTNFSNLTAAWSSSGINVGGGSTNYLFVTPITNGGNRGAWINVSSYSALGSTGFESFTNNSHAGGGNYIPYVDNNFYMDWGASRLSIASNTTANTPYFYHANVENGLQTILKNNIQLASKSVSVNNTNTFSWVIQGYAGGNSATCALGLFSNIGLTPYSTNLYSLYKQTLGNGLGLP